MATHTKFDAEHYSITVSGLHVQVTEAMKQYAIERVSKIEKFTNDIIDIHVTMDIVKLNHIVEISMKLKYLQINSKSQTTDMYASINEAVNKLEKQIRRYKGRLQEHQ
ncbi:MAG: ribosome-associated translation inhibitor RaiA, partial [Chlamydiia bacterium]|nr:ribosome-associated translation inhibitor RaiA [Chlamydiia bacterium]